MNASIMSGSIAGPAQTARPSPEYPTAHASPSNAAVFADRIERLQRQWQAPAEETDAAEAFADGTQAGMPAARTDRRRVPQDDVPAAAALAPVPGRLLTDPIEAAASAIDPSTAAPEGMPAARSDRRRMPQDDVAAAAAIAPVPGRLLTDPIEAAASAIDPSTIAASTNDVRTASAPASAPSGIDASAAAPEAIRDIDRAAPSAPDHAVAPETGGMQAGAPASDAENVFTPPEIGHGAQYATRSATVIGSSRAGAAADTAFVPPTGKTSSQLTLRGDMQALLGEFEASIRHFENAGGRWIGNARIAFHSDVLNGASVLITGNEKTLDVLIRQSVLSPLSASFSRQEKQFSEELTRRLGRSVTLHIAHVSNQLAAGDAEAQ